MTIIELMVVLSFIAVGILALSVVQMYSYSDVHRTGRSTQALDLARLRIETARAAGYTSAKSDSGVVDQFNWTCRVDSVGVSLKRVTSTVSWADGTTPRSLQLRALLSSR